MPLSIARRPSCVSFGVVSSPRDWTSTVPGSRSPPVSSCHRLIGGPKRATQPARQPAFSHASSFQQSASRVTGTKRRSPRPNLKNHIVSDSDLSAEMGGRRLVLISTDISRITGGEDPHRDRGHGAIVALKDGDCGEDQKGWAKQADPLDPIYA